MTGVVNTSAIPLLFVAVGVAWALWLSIDRFAVGLALVIVCYVLAASVWSVALGFPDLRPFAVVIALALLFGRPRVGLQPRQRVVALCLLAVGLLTLLSLFWSVAPHRTLLATEAWFALIVIVVAVLGSGERVADLVGWLMVSLLLVCLVVGLLHLPNAWNAGRLRGVLDNANGVGVLSALAGPFLASKRSFLSRCIWVLVVIACVLSGSRAGALGLALGTGIVLWRQWGVFRRYFVFPLLTAGLLLAIQPLQRLLAPQPLLLFRTNNSREEVWALALRAHSEAPWFGVGGGALQTLSGSSALKVLAELGYVGAGLASAIIVIFFALSRSSPLCMGVCVAGFVNAVFEGWLFAAGSPYAVIFFLLIGASLAPDPGSIHPLKFLRSSANAGPIPMPTHSRDHEAKDPH